MYVGYDADSGHTYTSMGRLLVLGGKIPEEDLTLSTLISYFDQHPHEIDSYLRKNDRYIFFKRVNHAIPYGSIGVPVTPMRSIATDKKVFPAGGLTFAVIEPKKAKKWVGGFIKKGKGRKIFLCFRPGYGKCDSNSSQSRCIFWNR